MSRRGADLITSVRRPRWGVFHVHLTVQATVPRVLVGRLAEDPGASPVLVAAADERGAHVSSVRTVVAGATGG